MRDTQDVFFDDRYWQPAERAAASRRRKLTAVSLAVVYDSVVHGSSESHARSDQPTVGHCQRTWRARLDQGLHCHSPPMARHERPVRLAKDGVSNGRLSASDRPGVLGLNLPLVVRDADISPATLGASPPGCYDGPQPATRSLALQVPLARGLDVRLCSSGLSDRGADIKADGIFGQTTARRVREYQVSQGLPATGVADPTLIADLVTWGV